MSQYIIRNGELYHYGVPGMKWGVIRAKYKNRSNKRLSRKAKTYDMQSHKAARKSEKLHAEYDLGRSNRQAVKAQNYYRKGDKAARKAGDAREQGNYTKGMILDKRSAKLYYKGSKAKLKGDTISKTTGYGSEAMKYSIKSDRLATKAAKARLKIAKNDIYISRMKTKVSDVLRTDYRDDVAAGREYLASLGMNSSYEFIED